MLIYIIFMAVLAAFLYRESKKVAEGRSNLLKDFCKDPLSTKAALSMLRIVFLASAASAAVMLICFIITQITGTMPKPVAALSILLYSIGFISAMFKMKNF